MKVSIHLLCSISFILPILASEQEASKNITFSCNIPGLNAPLQLERTNESIDKIQLICAAISHGRLLSKQLKSQQNVQEMIIDHALLAAFRITIGLTSTMCHEFGHAICKYYDSSATLEAITFGWSPANILLGTFDRARTSSVTNFSCAEKDEDQPIEIRCNNRIALLNQDKDIYRNQMIGCAAGPLLGALSAYIIYKRAEYIYPSLPYRQIAFYKIENQFENMIPLKHIFTYIGNRFIAHDEQKKRKLEQMLAEKTGSDGDNFYEAWNKRQKTQYDIDVFNDLYKIRKIK